MISTVTHNGRPVDVEHGRGECPVCVFAATQDIPIGTTITVQLGTYTVLCTHLKWPPGFYCRDIREDDESPPPAA